MESPLENARRRLAEELRSPCASPWDIAFWRSEVSRLRLENEQQMSPFVRRAQMGALPGKDLTNG